MASVRAFQFPGLKMWFWSLDHESPHFHAKRRGEWEVKVYFLRRPSEMIEVEWADKAPSSKQLNELASLAREHRVELLAQWEEIHQI